VRHKASQELFGYWNALRGSRPAPERSEIEPSDIRTILGDTFILEVSQQFRTVSFRLAGTRLCAAHGRELKGLGYLALWQEEDNYEVARNVARVYRDQEPMLMSYVGRTESGKTAEYEALLLPLAAAADGNPRILGIATARALVWWLGTEPLVANVLKHARKVEAKPSGSEISEISAGKSAVRRFGHLTVLDGGRASDTIHRH
jgi:hypothetical protein